MAAKKGNEWWRLRTKHGRDKNFKTPEDLWQACVEYFEVTDKRKWIKVDFRGKNASKVNIPTDTPYTMTGLYLFLGIDDQTWINYRTKENYKEYFEVVTRVDQIIYTQKFEGAAVGAFSSNIIARDLGLAEKTLNENSNKTAISFDLSNLSMEEENALFEISLKLKENDKS